MMIESRGSASSTFLNGNWWITGGKNPIVLKSTEVYNADNNSFVSYVNLPRERFSHNMVSVADDRVMMLGGQSTYTDTYFYDDTDQAWTDGPRLSSARFNSQAGLVTFPNGTKMVIAVAGYQEQSTEFLNIQGFSQFLPYYKNMLVTVFTR